MNVTEINPLPPAAVQHGLSVKEPQWSQGPVRTVPLVFSLQAQVHLQEPGAAKHPQVQQHDHNLTYYQTVRQMLGCSFFIYTLNNQNKAEYVVSSLPACFLCC